MKAHNEPYDRCNFFTKVTYEITYKVEYPWVSKSNQFYIYFRKRSWTIINFTYYPYYEDDVVEKVYYFFSRIRPDEPLVIGFTTRGKKTKYYRYAYINLTKSTGLPQGGFGEGDVVKNLWNENKKINKKLTFITGKGNNVHINGIPDEEEPKPNYTGKFKSVFRKANIDPEFYGTPNGSYIFYSDNIFTINKKMNTIDSKIFEKLNGLTFYAIYVYYTAEDDIAVLVELIKDFNDTIFIARKNREGSLWEKVEISRSDDTEFNSELQKIVHNWVLNHKSGTSKPIEYTNHAEATLNDCDPKRKITPSRSSSKVTASATESFPKPGSVKRQEVSNTSQYQTSLGRDQSPTAKASLSSPQGKPSSSNPESTHSRQSGSASVTSGPTRMTSGHSSSPSPGLSGQGQTKDSLSPPRPPSTNDPPTSQKGPDIPHDKSKDTGVPPSLDTPPRVDVAQKLQPSHTANTELRGETGTISGISHTQKTGPTEQRGVQNIPRSVERRPSNHLPSDSSSDLNPQSDKRTGGEKNYGDNDSVSKTVKIAAGAGVATTAIGAGAIGGGAHYAHGVLGVIKWLV